jgi:hypothetical protein
VSPPDIRRHVVYLSDREIGVVERAVRAYAVLMQIQTAAPSKREANDNAHACAVIQAHGHCKCPVPQDDLSTDV